jgi:hypothetical protein
LQVEVEQVTVQHMLLVVITKTKLKGAREAGAF